jgi:hypothetical protein
MPLFGDCPVCAEKTKHIEFLEGLVTTLQKQLVELTAPGANARIAWTQPPPREKKPSTASYSPSRLAQTRKDLPTARESQASVVTAQDVEASFKQ